MEKRKMAKMLTCKGWRNSYRTQKNLINSIKLFSDDYQIVGMTKSFVMILSINTYMVYKVNITDELEQLYLFQKDKSPIANKRKEKIKGGN